MMKNKKNKEMLLHGEGFRQHCLMGEQVEYNPFTGEMTDVLELKKIIVYTCPVAVIFIASFERGISE